MATVSAAQETQVGFTDINELARGLRLLSKKPVYLTRGTTCGICVLFLSQFISQWISEKGLNKQNAIEHQNFIQSGKQQFDLQH